MSDAKAREIVPSASDTRPTTLKIIDLRDMTIRDIMLLFAPDGSLYRSKNIVVPKTYAEIESHVKTTIMHALFIHERLVLAPYEKALKATLEAKARQRTWKKKKP